MNQNAVSLRNISLASLAGLCLLIAINIFGYLKFKDNEVNNKWVHHTFKVIADLEQINNDFLELGNLQRGYIITGQSYYELNFQKKLTAMDVHINNFSKLVSDNPEQIERFEKAVKLIRTQQDYYFNTRQLVKNGKHDEAVKLVKTGRGQLLNKEFQEMILAMKHVEENLLGHRLKAEAEARTNASRTIFIGSLIAILIIISFTVMAYRENRRRELVKKELNKSNQIQKAILNASAFALMATDEHGRITLFNPAAEKLLGYSAEEVMGKSPTLFHDPHELVHMKEILEVEFNDSVPVGFEVLKYRADKKIIESDQWTYIRKDKVKFPVKFTLTAIDDLEGNTTGYVGIAYDVTKQLEFESALIKAREEAISATKAKSEFLANMSHEIRTPMNAIIGMGQILKETKLTEEQTGYVDIFLNAGNGLLNIINDILDLSKIEAGYFELGHEAFKLSTVVTDVSQMVAIKAHQKGLELTVDFSEDLHDYYVGDGGRIRQILLNLLSNSIKFTKKGEVTLKLTPGRKVDAASREILIEVTDTGIGMSEAQIQKLFERFVQADSSITKQFGGTGLGLNITRKLVELMKGHVEVQSSEGSGTKFKIKIVLEERAAEHEETVMIQLSGKRFLIVDDTRTNRIILRNMLEKTGAIVEEAQDGEDALAKITASGKQRRPPFDSVILDCRMPGMDGFTLAEKIKEMGDKIPMLMMLTSDDRPGDLARSKNIGLNAYLIKPVLRQSLMNSLAKAFQDSARVENQEQVAQNETATNKSFNVLLVDDHDPNRMIIKAFLKSLNCKIDEASNGAEAVDLYKAKNYDVVLMDMQMPVMDGYTATRTICDIQRDQDNFVPVLALTAYAFKEDIEKSIASGCISHLTKPVEKDVLREKVLEMVSPVAVEIDPDLKDLVADYLIGRKEEIKKLNTAFLNEDYHFLKTTGHKLRGSAGSYGFQKLSEIGKTIEESAERLDKHTIQMSLAQYALYLKLLQMS